ncbi:hypothetical protein H261_20814 [Paramagnetospirillum caucaseum]|uniref:Uncharacterized protein n=1 Tax=Paramagnetospirillum caucaseum TaxID=1244869 RepID=M2Y4F6_9PROT|nr:hypothetical protein [Paramagnetospirillum caucaseum]EME67976.1 hypothetical protein H261_20814 [Paramagnetospirillum caucaseum]
MFIRSSTSKGHTYWRVVESHRVNGRVVQREIVGLGSCETVAEAIVSTRLALRDAEKKLSQSFGDLVPADLTDEVAVGATRDSLKKTKAAAFIRSVNAILKLRKDLGLMEMVAPILGEIIPPDDAASEFQAMKKKCPEWGTW